jgi:hypothetical protein
MSLGSRARCARGRGHPRRERDGSRLDPQDVRHESQAAAARGLRGGEFLGRKAALGAHEGENRAEGFTCGISHQREFVLTAVENGGAGRSKMVALGGVDLP